MPNAGARGEAILRVGDEEYPILYTNRALADAEQRTGKSALAMARAPMEMGIGDLAHLLVAGIEAARRDAHLHVARRFTVNDALALLDEVGFVNALPVVIEAMGNVLMHNANQDDADFQPEAEEPENPPE